MINFFTSNYSVSDVLKAVRSLPPDKWPKASIMIEVAEQASRNDQLIILTKVFETFSSRVHPNLSGEDQKAIWMAWEKFGYDGYSKAVKERYVLQRINNEVMWLPEDLRKKINTGTAEYKALCKDFFGKKSAEWRTILVPKLEIWLRSSKAEFRELLEKL